MSKGTNARMQERGLQSTVRRGHKRGGAHLQSMSSCWEKRCSLPVLRKCWPSMEPVVPNVQQLNRQAHNAVRRSRMTLKRKLRDRQRQTACWMPKINTHTCECVHAQFSRNGDVRQFLLETKFGPRHCAPVLKHLHTQKRLRDLHR